MYRIIVDAINLYNIEKKTNISINDLAIDQPPTILPQPVTSTKLIGAYGSVLTIKDSSHEFKSPDGTCKIIWTYTTNANNSRTYRLYISNSNGTNTPFDLYLNNNNTISTTSVNGVNTSGYEPKIYFETSTGKLNIMSNINSLLAITGNKDGVANTNTVYSIEIQNASSGGKLLIRKNINGIETTVKSYPQ